MSTELTTLPSYDLAKVAESMQLAETLQRFVKEKNLTVSIQGKQYPLVESWQWAASQLGLVPIVQSIECLSGSNVMSGDAEIKYKSSVDLVRVSDGMIISRGFAICSNKEYSKKKFDEYAIASMAQTRAVGKACRNLLAWLMKAAGFEATPAEEMDFARAENTPDEGEKDLLRKLVYNSTLDENKRAEALATIDGCNSYELYQRIQHRLESMQIPFDQIPNPSTTDAKKQTARVSKMPAA